ncbi:MAG: hypothetical protein EYC70_01500 [Planctomycetota bacterium]|nr:MAG: hypothetical protein EYC70_01500 [Planctomycetota bacterium]
MALHAILLLLAGPGRCPQEAVPPSLHYRVSYAGTERDSDWHVRVEGRGLAYGGGPLFLHLEDWGEWTEVDSYHLRNLTCDPPLRRHEGSRCDWLLDPPADWDGSLALQYDIATVELGSPVRGSHGLVPYRAPTYCFGFSTNTLITADRAGWDTKPRLTFRIEAPPDWTIASGLGGVAVGVLEGQFPAEYDNGVISMGRPVAQDAERSAVALIEVVQWGGGESVVPSVLDFARVFVNECARTSGRPPRQPIRLLITEPGFGGTRTDGSIAIGCPELGQGAMGPGTLHFVAHELFHDWLGGQLRGEGERLAWFWEGFTDYLSLWHLARAGMVSHEWFAQRLLDYDRSLADNAHRGSAAYADPAVNWRDPEIEPLAYQGSALLAFSLDVALRRAGREGLMEMMRALLARPGGRYDLEALRSWLVDNGQAEFWERRFAVAATPDLAADLEFAGFEHKSVETTLTYLGIQLEGEGPFGRILAVDPQGPAAACGVRADDVVSGCWPVHQPPTVLGPEVSTPYRFGLGLYQTDAKACNLGVRRGEQELEFAIPPRLIPGGRRSSWAPRADRIERFFQ